MTTDIARTAEAPNLPTITGGGAPGLGILRDWVQAASDAHTLVAPIVNSAFLPTSMRHQDPAVTMANATSAVLLGMSLGLDPLTALQNIYVVHGRPGMYSKMKVALALAAGHEVWQEVYEPERVVVCGRRKGSDQVVRIELTMDDAKRAGWTSNAAYAKTPADMLTARAQGRVVDRIAADTLAGISSVEDLDDAPAPTVRVTAAEIRREAPSLPPAPEPPAAPDVLNAHPAPRGPSVEVVDVPSTEGQRRKLNEAFNARGVNGDGQTARRKAIVERVIGRAVESTKDLTSAEADLVLSTVQGADAPGWADLTGGDPVAEQAAAEATYQLAEQSHSDAEAEAAQTVEVGPVEVADYDPTGEADWPGAE
jgi:hypothetical protein